MREVEVSKVFEYPYDETEDLISPILMIEFEEMLNVKGFEKTDESVIITVANNEIKDDIEMDLIFTKTKNGCEYYQVGEGIEGLFDYLHTEITISGNMRTHIRIRSYISFNGIFTFIKEWFGASFRRKEIELMILNIEKYLNDNF